MSGVESVERRLSVSLPAGLRCTPRATVAGQKPAGQWWVVWPLARLAEDNERAWADGKLARDLLAFGDDGTGNPFCVILSSDADEVLRWNWLDQDVEVNEGSMEQFVRTWLDRG